MAMRTCSHTLRAVSQRGPTLRSGLTAQRSLHITASSSSASSSSSSSSSSPSSLPSSAPTSSASLISSRALSPSAFTSPQQHRPLHTTPRVLATPPPRAPPPSGEVSASEYHTIADKTFDELVNELDELIMESEKAAEHDWEFEFSQGVLTLQLPPHGTYVLNKQPANKQIWLSSPSSGPKRFDYDTQQAKWICIKDGTTTVLDELLNTEISGIFGQPVALLASSS